jgi:hypothetical protein
MLPTNYYSGDQYALMGGECGTHGGDVYNGFHGEPEGSRPL